MSYDNETQLYQGRKESSEEYTLTQQQERFNVYDAVAAVNAVQKLKQAGFPVTRIINDRTLGLIPPYESGSASSGEDQNLSSMPHLQFHLN